MVTLHAYLTEVLEPVVVRVEVSSENLASLKALMANYRETVRQSIGKSDLRSPDNIDAMLASVTSSLNSYLTDVLQPIVTALGYVLLTHVLCLPVICALHYCSKENPSKEVGVVLLADTHLLSLPLETLPLLQRDNISFVSRDFSLQMLQHRMNKNIRENSGKGWKKN